MITSERPKRNVTAEDLELSVQEDTVTNWLASRNQQVKENLRTKRLLSKRFGWRCWYCGFKLAVDGGHLDHITPKSRGGTEHSRNLALTCEFCNFAKHDHTLDVFMSWLEWVRSGGSFTPYNLTPAEVCDAVYRSKGG